LGTISPPKTRPDLWVNTLCFIPPGTLSGQWSEGALVCGASDGRISLWTAAGYSKQEAPLLSFIAHTAEVISLAYTSDGMILSGSGDNTAAIWNIAAGGSRVAALVGHQYPVWGVTALDNSNVVTASADLSIRVWDRSGNQLVQPILDSADRLRGVINLSGIGFVTCSNDGSITLYSYDGVQMEKMEEHDGPIFSIRLGNEGTILTAAEDGTVRVWKGWQAGAQALQHPCGLWDVTQLENGDLVSAGQDKVARVWTADPSRLATTAQNEALDAQVVATMQMIEQAKIKALEEHMIDGEQFDFVWPIEIDGAQGGNLKLGYNLSDNPWETAEKFLMKYKLPADNKEAIVQHILKSTQGQRKDTVQGNKMVEAVYGSSAQSRAPAEVAFQSSYFPNKSILLCDQSVNYAGLEKKIKEINSEYEASPTSKNLALSPDDIETLGLILGKLMQKNQWHTIQWMPREYALVYKLLAWDGDKIFPALDFLRCWAIHYDVASQFGKFLNKSTFATLFGAEVPAVLSGFTGDFVTDVASVAIHRPGHPANKRLACWIFCNMFSASVPSQHHTELLDTVRILKSSPVAGEETAASILLLNLCTVWHADPSNLDALELIKDWLQATAQVSPVTPHTTALMGRLLCSFGTLVCNNKGLQRKSVQIGLVTLLKSGLPASTDPYLTACAAELRRLFNI